MEDQGQKNHLSGVETQHHHQVHHCRECGWPFPKPQPSAKHRRAHKRVCGTLEGYKLQDSSHTIVSDDDHSDDGDFKTPQISFKKRLERSPSEDDFYSDAVSNFADASLNSGVGGSPEIATESASAVEKVSETVVPEFGASAEGTPAGNLTSSVTGQAPMIAPNIADKSGKRPDSGDLSSTNVAETQFDFPEGASNVHESDAESLVELLTGIKSPENDATAELSLNDKAKVIEEINDTPDAAEPVLQATDEVSAIADQGFTLTVETPNGKLVSETPQNDISPEHFAVQESEGADSGDVVEHNSKADEGVHLFHVPHDVPAVEHPEKFIEGFKDHPKKEDVRPDNFDLEVEHSSSVGEYNTIEEEELRKVNVFSVLQDVPVLVNQEKIVEGFKDGHDNMDFPNGVEEKGEVSCPASDVLLEKDGLISNPIDQEVEVEAVTDVVHKSQQLHEYDNSSDAIVDRKKKGISDEEASLEGITVGTSREFDSNLPVKSAEEVTSYASEEDGRSMNFPCVVPDSVPVIEATTHTAGECLSGEVGVIKEEEVSDVIKSLSDTASVLSLDSGAPRTILAGKDDSNSAVEIVSTGIHGDGKDKNMEDKIPAFLSSEAPSAIEDGYVNESFDEIHHPISDAVTVTGAEAIMKGNAEEEEVSGTVDTRTLNLDTEGDNTIYAVETSEFDGSKEDVEFADNSSSPPVTEKLPLDVENGTIADEERFVGLHSSVDGDSSAAEIGVVHVAEDDSVKKEAPAEESNMQSSPLDESAFRSSLDESAGMEKRGVAVVESQRKSAANETLTDGCLEAERTTVVVVDEVLAEKEQLKKGDEVKGSSNSMNELGNDFDKEAALLQVGTVSQVPNSLTVEDGTKQQLTASVLDSSSSRTESLDANWGSVSVVSTQSDTITPSDEPRKVGKANTKQQQQEATAVGDKLETSFEDPSSLVSTQDAAASNDNNYYSPGRKKEEMIAKVTNWTVKQPQQQSVFPLKNVSVEANREIKPVSHILKENDIAPKVEEEKKDDSVKEDNSAAAASSTVASILTSSTEEKAAAAAAAVREEWNSPARYPTEIKKDKKKVKSRPYWAQFVCCSSAIN